MSLALVVPPEDESDTSDEELICLWYLARKRKREIRERRYWVHDILKKRKEAGEYHRLVKELQLDSERFYQYFRMSREQFHQLLTFIEKDISKQDTQLRDSISGRERLAITIRFLATGCSYKTLGFSYRVSASAIGRIVPEVCEVIWDKLMPVYMRLPQDENDWKVLAENFSQRWNFPHCIGCIDGKHIKIKAPDKSGSLFYNYKHHFSIVLLAIADASYRFIMVDIGSYGRNGDSAILSHSNFGKLFKKGKLNIPNDEPLHDCPELGPMPYVILGDEAFPLSKNLMRPYPGGGKKVLPDTQAVFNYRLSRARRIVENAFGILATRWRVYYTTIMIQADNVTKITRATTVLHNFLQSVSTPAQIASMVEEAEVNIDNSILTSITKYGTRGSDEAENIRSKFEEYFTGKGNVPW